MRISDWSSDVCSSDLLQHHIPLAAHARRGIQVHGIDDADGTQCQGKTARQSQKEDVEQIQCFHRVGWRCRYCRIGRASKGQISRATRGCAIAVRKNRLTKPRTTRSRLAMMPPTKGRSDESCEGQEYVRKCITLWLTVQKQTNTI